MYGSKHRASILVKGSIPAKLDGFVTLICLGNPGDGRDHFLGVVAQDGGEET
jgi:hypothetical protein